MRLFSLAEASHFCSNYTQEVGDSEYKISDFYARHLAHVTTMAEQSRRFSEYRACLLREIERNLFLSIGQYRRSLDLMLSSSSHWAFVTIYYGSWYAAQAILGLYGGRVFKKDVIDVGVGTPGNQRLDRRRIGNGVGEEPTLTTGSHRNFWKIYYNSVTSLVPTIPVELTMAVSPVSANEFWQIEARNEINYETFSAIDLNNDFQAAFSATSFPASLPGPLSTQYQVAEAMIEYAFGVASSLHVATDALALYGTSGLKSKIRQHIYSAKAPALVRRSRKVQILST